jgi:hypothetical protein
MGSVGGSRWALKNCAPPSTRSRHRLRTCIKALLEYERASDTEFQILYFGGNWADGSGFTIRSDRIRPGADVNLAARATAERLLQERNTA